jgi:peptidoglycan/LPS O-acetylase OafA/YrhL
LLALEMAMKAVRRQIPFAGDWVESSTFIALLALGLTIAMAIISYEYLELPFLRLKSRFAVIPSRPA